MSESITLPEAEINRVAKKLAGMPLRKRDTVLLNMFMHYDEPDIRAIKEQLAIIRMRQLTPPDTRSDYAKARGYPRRAGGNRFRRYSF